MGEKNMKIKKSQIIGASCMVILLIIISIHSYYFKGVDGTLCNVTVADFDYRITTDNETTYLLDSHGCVVSSNPSGHDDTTLFTTAISKLQSGGKLSLGHCCYYINNTQLNIPSSVTIEGNNWDSNASKPLGTNIFFDNYSGITLNSFNVLRNVDLNFAQKTLSSNNVLISGTNGKMENVYILGSNQNVPAGLRMIGIPTNPIAGWEFDHVKIHNFTWDLKCVSCSQNYFEDMQLANYNIGMFLSNSDNNHFGHLLFNNAKSLSNIDVQFGDTANDGTGDNAFQFLTVQVGDTNIVSNAVFNSTVSYDLRPNHIYMLGIDGCANIKYNNHSWGQVDIEHTSYPACNGK